MKRVLLALLLLTPCAFAQSIVMGSVNSTGSVVTVTNEGSTGTLLNGLAKYTGAPSTAIKTAITDMTGAIGVVVAGNGTTGTATIQTSGDVSCVFDGATTANDIVVISVTTAGDCHDAGVTATSLPSVYPQQAVGIVKSTNGSGGTYTMTLFPAFEQAPGQASATSVTVNTNTTGDQNLMAFTLKPGALNIVNKMLKVEGAGIYTTQSAQTPTLTFKVKLCTVSGCGSGTVITACSWTTAATTASVTNSWYIDYCKIGTISTGATGTVIGKGRADVQIGATGGVRAPEIDVETNNAASASVDLTAQLFVQVTVTFSTNAAGANVGTEWEGSALLIN